MFFVVQFPLCDTRCFLTDRGNRLAEPDWPPGEKSPRQFVRSFGRAEVRRYGPGPGWADQKSYCRAQRAVRFPGLRGITLGGAEAPCEVDVIFRRLFHDGEAVARVEIGFEGRPRPETPPGALRWLAPAQGILRLPSHVPLKLPPIRDVGLAQQGPTLARLLARASSKAVPAPVAVPGVAAGRPAPGPRGVDDGNPMLIVELEPEEWAEPPGAFRKIDRGHVGGADLAFGWVRATPDLAVATWVLSRGDADPEAMRSLRLCLLRLHAEREVLVSVINQIRRGWIVAGLDEEAAEALNDYLKRASRLINKKRRAGITQEALLRAFDAGDEVGNPADRALLIERHVRVREMVWRKVRAFVESRKATRVVLVNHVEGDQIMGNQGIINDFKGATLNHVKMTNVIADQVENSFNEAAARLGGQDDKKKALADLHELVKKLNGSLNRSAPADPDVLAKQEEIGANFKALAELAAAAKPSPRVLKATGEDLIDSAAKAAETAAAKAPPVEDEPKAGLLGVTRAGLVEAAKAVAEMVVPITVGVKGVLALYGIVLP